MVKLKNIPVVKSDNRGIVYDCDRVSYVDVKKGSISKEHSHNIVENIFLLKGRAQLIVGDRKLVIDSPKKIIIPKNANHELKALTNITLVFYK